DDDHARREDACHLRDRADEAKAAPSCQQDGPPLHASGEIHDGERLAGAGRPKEQETAFDRAARRDEPLGMLAEGDRIAVDAVEDAAWEDHVLTRDRRQVVEGDDRLRSETELLRPERDDLPAID